jgi:hypothetical protein
LVKIVTGNSIKNVQIGKQIDHVKKHIGKDIAQDGMVAGLKQNLIGRQEFLLMARMWEIGGKIYVRLYDEAKASCDKFAVLIIKTSGSRWVPMKAHEL